MWRSASQARLCGLPQGGTPFAFSAGERYSQRRLGKTASGRSFHQSEWLWNSMDLEDCPPSINGFADERGDDG
jgi:hypothetical protein